MNQSIFPNLVVQSIEATLPWYQQNLGAEVKMTVPSQADPAKACFATLIVSGNDIMFQTVDNLEEKYPQLKGQVAIGCGVALNIQVEDAQAIFDQLSDTSGIVAQPSNTFCGMREFTIKDPNGYLLTIASLLSRNV